jgi:hypothetical protein
MLALALLCAAPQASRSEILIEGDEASLRVVVDKATLSDVLAALKAKFRFRYALTVDPSREISGTISGPLHRVVARLLDGYDFIVKRSPEGVELVRIAPRGTADAVPQARAGVTVWQTPAAQAMTPPPSSPQ